jgi:hypothetical protein
MQFDHVINPLVRAVLYGATEKPADIVQAAYLTEAAMAEDWKSQFVSFETMTARESHIDTMTDCLIAKDMPGVIFAMRAFWLV